ncbi:PadR family transcriptional regulator [Youngiibacter fragilis]|uniref:PadR family transcriptional regulator n=1 Tax=Youngiibacter fragilis 232.1 TaxID=994573 RepID=V7I755_9CLOT|nr:PadR family transcriptional regulator [Youngiibacter fragilis]ETA81698.1 PadR family transcriptional regulator [Youngiibacter fragilis 232.1]
MIFHARAELLDAIVLAVIFKNSEGNYGYKIARDVREKIDISESTLYPVLRRLEKDNFLEVYDIEYKGRNRRYYKVTAQGNVQLISFCEAWRGYSKKIDKIFMVAEQ